MSPRKHWIVVADGRTARLLSFQKVPGGRWRAEEQASLDSQWEDYHERHRPYALDHGPSQTSREHFSSGSTDTESHEERRRFARDVVRWLDQDPAMPADRQVTVFAAPGLFGTLREELDRLNRRVDLQEMELTQLHPHELAEHRGVLRALDAETRRPVS